MTIARRVKLFRSGGSQAVRIPRAFELPGADAIIRKEGDKLIVEPAATRSLLGVLVGLRPLEEDFPAIDDAPPERVEF
jgi:antitoxin VapB